MTLFWPLNHQINPSPRDRTDKQHLGSRTHVKIPSNAPGLFMLQTDMKRVNLRKKMLEIFGVCWFVWFNINAAETKGRGIWRVETDDSLSLLLMKHCLAKLWVRLGFFLVCAAFFLLLLAPVVCLMCARACLFQHPSCMCARWVSAALTWIWCDVFFRRA